MARLFALFLSDPLPFLKKEASANPDYPPSYILDGFVFFECACEYYDRLTKDERQKAEALIVEGIEFSRGDKKDEFLLLTILGSGGLLQDLIIVGKLIQKGFNKIKINFVDPATNIYKVGLLENLLKSAFNISLNCFGGTVPIFPESHAVIAVDFNPLYQADGKCWNLFFKSHSTLGSTGLLYAFSQHNFILNHLGMIYDPFENLKMSNFIGENENFLKDKKIEVIVIKEISKGNFNLPYIAQMIQLLASKFKSETIVHLCGNDIPELSHVLPIELAKQNLHRLANVRQLSVQSIIPIPPQIKGHIYIYQGSPENHYSLDLKTTPAS